MIDRKLKLRWRRRIRYGKRQVEDIGFQAEEHLERHFLRRLGRLVNVRRFVASWLLLFVLLGSLLVAQINTLSGYYQQLRPAAGGSFTEGILGAFTNANPIYATGPVDSAVSKLLFDSLFKFDSKNRLTSDLAKSWNVDSKGLVYTITLRPNLKWHDGYPLNADDVVFTYQTIQNPDAKSPLFSSWQGINVQAIDSQTVRFTLPNTLSSFPYGLTNGIIPKHVLQYIEPEQLRSVAYNTVDTIGSGPFKWDALRVLGTNVDDREERVGLVANKGYFLGQPKLQRFVIRAFHGQKKLISSLKAKELNGVTGLDAAPKDIVDNGEFNEMSVPLTAEVMLFFNTTQPILKDVNVRKALVLATNQQEIIQSLGYPVIGTREPLLQNQFAYDKRFVQAKYNLNRAAAMLDSAGWKLSGDGIRRKGGVKLSFNIHSESTSDYSVVTQKIQSQWRAIGVDLQVVLDSGADLQQTLAESNYDSLLYGISIGADPDVFPYWDSAQANASADNAVNFSKYKSVIADAALEAGRTRTDQKLRAIKYRTFLSAWRNDAPAIALYQPRFLYIVHGNLFNFDSRYLNVASDRFNNVANWMVRQKNTNK